MLNKAQEYIYNTYLKNLRDGKPFQYRKTFLIYQLKLKAY